MQALIMAAQLITALSILVTIHELGHYWAARAFGIRVEKFYLFFDAWGFKLFSFKKGGTEWGIGWLPLGGYVKIAGMIDESMDTEQMKKPAEDWEFRSKPAWQRLIVMIGGVVMNIILGVFIFAMLAFKYGEMRTINSSIKYGIIPSTLATEMGFQKGDKIVGVNGKPLLYFEDAMNPNELLSDNPYFTINRNGVDTIIKLPQDFATKISGVQKADFFTPRMTFTVNELQPNYNAEKAGLKSGDIVLQVNNENVIFFDEFQTILKKYTGQSVDLKVLRGTDSLLLRSEIDATGKIGIGVKPMEFEFDSVKFSFIQSFPKGIQKGVETLSLQLKGFGKIFSGDIPANKAVQGPIGIAKIFGSDWIWSRFWTLTALISIVLAFMNILPIPALDGGHVVILCIEMILGRPLSDKIIERIQTVGMFILIALTIFVFGNDILQLFIK
jgi:regulator of sigma E protease